MASKKMDGGGSWSEPKNWPRMCHSIPDRSLVQWLPPNIGLNLHISQRVNYSEHLTSSTIAPLLLPFPGSLGDGEGFALNTVAFSLTIREKCTRITFISIHNMSRWLAPAGVATLKHAHVWAFFPVFLSVEIQAPHWGRRAVYLFLCLLSPIFAFDFVHSKFSNVIQHPFPSPFVETGTKTDASFPHAGNRGAYQQPRTLWVWDQEYRESKSSPGYIGRVWFKKQKQ